MGTASRMSPNDPESQLTILKRGTAELLSEAELRAKLTRKKPLIIKAGFDPTAPDLHLGHTVLLRKLRQFQELGHYVVFLIGDATALVGDPSGQNKMRKLMTWDEVNTNAQTYERQVTHKALLKQDPEVFVRRHNSEWFSRSGGGAHGRSVGVGFDDLVELTSKYTIARLLERDDFQKRMKSGQEISVLEILYPLFQGYDSYQLKADVELGGTDQKFNLLVGRAIQRAYDQEPQVVMTVPLLVGLDGTDKMSKSLGNHVGITDAAKDMFGKLMSMPDTLMESYCTLLTDLMWSDLKSEHPKQAKMLIAQDIVTQYHGADAGEAEAKAFDQLFKEKQVPDDVQEVTIVISEGSCDLEELYAVAKDILASCLHIQSKSDLRRLCAQGGLKIDGQAATSLKSITCYKGITYTIQAGPRRFVRISLK
jgi:tyrosyl-tRNA synthetase